MTAWAARDQVVAAFSRGTKRASAVARTNEYGSAEVWYEDGDRMRLVVNAGDDAVVLYVFTTSPRADRTGLAHGCLEYEVRLSGMPVAVALATLAAARQAAA